MISMYGIGSYLAELVKAQLNGNTAGQLPNGITVGELIKIAESNHLLYLLLGALVKIPNISEEEREQLRKKIIVSLFISTKQILEIKSLEECFENAGIVNQPMKGAVLRFLYPSPEMREMSDIDMLIEGTGMVKAQNILLERGYTLSQSIKHHDIYTRLDGMVVEAHHVLYDKTVDKNQYSYFTNFSRTSLKDGCKYTYEFSIDNFYIYMMAHMAKHFYQMGCGIRHLVDIYVYLNKYGNKMNRNYVDSELKKCGILTFTKHMEKLSYVWLDEKPHEELYDYIFSYMLDSGIYGKDENGIWNKFAEKKQKNKKVSRFQLKMWYSFPPLSYMSEYYSYLENKPWLLPWAWLTRGWCGIWENKGIYKRKMINNIDNNNIQMLKTIYEKMDLGFKI